MEMGIKSTVSLFHCMVVWGNSKGVVAPTLHEAVKWAPYQLSLPNTLVKSLMASFLTPHHEWSKQGY